MIRTQISLDAKLYEEARREARRRGVSFAELVRRALVQLIRRDDAKAPWMRLAGVVEDAGPDASRSIDAVVYGRERP